MIDHIGITVRDLERSKQFYTQALAVIGSGLPHSDVISMNRMSRG